MFAGAGAELIDVEGGAAESAAHDSQVVGEFHSECWAEDDLSELVDVLLERADVALSGLLAVFFERFFQQKGDPRARFCAVMLALDVL